MSAAFIGLDLGSFVVATGPLPRHPPCPGDRLDVAVALCRRGRGCVAQDGVHARWHDHRGLGMPVVLTNAAPGCAAGRQDQRVAGAPKTPSTVSASSTASIQTSNWLIS